MISLDLTTLSRAYAEGRLTPSAMLGIVAERIRARGDDAVWITRTPAATLAAHAAALEAMTPAEAAALPLWGIPFAAKDNIDVAGLPTTAGCPAFAYAPGGSAAVVRRLEAAGAICLGKTNLDQLATGLVGVRSPYGVARNPFDPAYIPGGSSSGSAVAVAAGLASFALGTDTAGSGRVPAGFNNIVGLKPTRGLLGMTGVVPACRTLDCVSIFALTAEDAAAVLRVAAAPDPDDPWSRAWPADRPQVPARFRFGVPRERVFFGNREAEAAFEQAIGRLEALGGTAVPFDFEPFGEAAALLYGGPWVAERYAAAETLIREDPDALLPVTRGIVEGALKHDAVASFKAAYRLEALRRRTAAILAGFEVMAVPTTGTIYTIAEVERDPVALNSNLGTYTNFVNFLDLSAIAVPNGFQSNGLPLGITLIGPAFADMALARLAVRWQRALDLPLGATGARLPPAPAPIAEAPIPDAIEVAVFGAHMKDLPLSAELEGAGAVFRRTVRTAPCYRMVLLDQFRPPRPGLLRVSGEGAPIEGEVWAMSPAAFGRFVAGIAAPLGIGTVALDDGTTVKGFLCEAAGAAGRRDITAFGGWRAFAAA